MNESHNNNNLNRQIRDMTATFLFTTSVGFIVLSSPCIFLRLFIMIVLVLDWITVSSVVLVLWQRKVIDWCKRFDKIERVDRVYLNLRCIDIGVMSENTSRCISGTLENRKTADSDNYTFSFSYY